MKTYSKKVDEIIKNLEEPIEVASKILVIKDNKTLLQERIQMHGNLNIK